MSGLIFQPYEKIKKKCLCCGEEMELEPYIEQDFCNKCCIIICQEVFNKANNNTTVKKIKEKIREKLRWKNDI